MYKLLSGLTVIEAASFVAAPSAGLYLAQMGADVIRVDQIGGGPDFTRWPQAPNGRSLIWENMNRAKRSLALDLGQTEGRALLQQLVRKTGQFITNFPASGFLAHDSLAAERPDLITIRVMGQADGGTALDYTVNCAVGYPDQTGEGPDPVNHVLPAWDLLTGAYAAFAFLAALRHRDETGAGQELRIPLQDVATATIGNLGIIAEMMVTGQNRERTGNAVFGAFGKDFATRDGKRVMLMAITPKQWTGLVEVLGVGAEIAAIEAAHGVSFARDEGLRYRHRGELFPLVAAKVASRDFAELKAALDAAGCCTGVYQTMYEAAHDPALVAGNPLFGRNAQGAANPSGADYPAAGAFATLPGEARAAPRPAPQLGADSDTVLGEILGLSPDEIGALRSRGIVG